MNVTRPFAASLTMFILWTVFVVAPAHAQGTNGPVAPKPGAPIQNNPDGAIRVKIAVVNAPVAVSGENGELILDLDKKDFHIYDNGAEQTIDTFDLGGEPLSVVLLFENSFRITALIPTVQKSAIVFTQTVIGPTGEAAVLTYSDKVDKLLPFTADHDQIEKTIGRLQVGTTGTHLYDGISTAVGILRDRPVTRRRVIIVIGEPRDSGSDSKLGEVLREAQLANVVIYTVALSTTSAQVRAAAQPSGPLQGTPPGIMGGPPTPGTVQTPTSQQQDNGNINLLAAAEYAVQHATALIKDHPLEVATAATGGLYQATFRERTIEKAVDTIGGELNAQYTLTYHPTSSDIPGYHRITVTVDRAGARVRTRPGYFLEAK